MTLTATDVATAGAGTPEARHARTAGGAAGGAPRRFLPEVQALRALAVALVVVYHVRPDLLPGGFIGVDVFFVISGYLITGHMLREVRTSGRLSLARFWAARARRILPAGLVVLAFVALTCTLVLPASEWAQVQRQLLASVLYVENWALASDSVDYLAAENAAAPVQHYWSLAVEEQFYLLWPLVLVGVVQVARRVRARASGASPGDRLPGRLLLLVFGVLVAASFVWNVTAVRGGDAAAYFATTTRLWELGVGGLLALLVRYTPRFAAARSAAALAGVAAIVVGAFAIDGATPYPGWAALVPVLGTALVVAAGRTTGPVSLTGVVDLRPVQWLGDVSYSVYLWHFPLVVYALARAGRPPTALEAAGLVGLTLGLAALSHRYVERPFRRRRVPDRGTLVLAAVAMVVVAALAGTIGLRAAAEQARWDRAAGQVVVADGSGFGAEATSDGAVPPFVDDVRVVVPAPTEVQDDAVTAFDEQSCSARKDDPLEPRTCELGDPDGRVTVALVGDSHARMLGSPVARLAEDRGWRLVTFLRDSCPFSAEPRTVPEGPTCVAANAVTLERLVELAPDAVVTVAYGGSRYRDPGTGERPGVRGTADVWRELEEAGIQVYAVKDAPQPDPFVVRCVAAAAEDPADVGDLDGCAVPRERALVGRDLVDAAAERVPGVDVVDLTDRYCGAESCPAVIGNVMVYRDTNHVTDTYARSLAPFLAGAIPAEP
ncbi:acyltransferase [Isoptericola sp. 4D.3]|uniref:Acyltransferase n=1 Tax=Isoptericola peretonis TaxID=2918523 RepID=A0ABT0J664_9MICO|nr:acyltransferase [Isoptericola sp. 4D.3]